jgi:PAT family beta-lactamase induction signal transducer AmpG
MFSHLDIPTEKSLFWTGLYALPWMLRPLWVPLIDRIGTPRAWVIVLQLLMGGLFAAAGAAAAMGAWFGALSCCFFAAAFASATHDAAADGFYIIALDASDQAKFSGIRSALYKAGTVLWQGGLAMAAGALAKFLSPGTAWGSVYAF